MVPTLETQRLLLREIRPEDIDSIYDCFSNAEAMKYYGQDPFTDKAQAINLINHFTSIHQEQKGMRWGIQLIGQDKLIGTIGFNLWTPKYRRAEIGYEIHPDFWGQGYATEIISEVIQYGFRELQLARIGAVVLMDNEASHKVLKKSGFEQEGILRIIFIKMAAPMTPVFILF